jgi:hypothetical protein
MDKKWRNCLNAAERQALRVDERCDEGLFEVFLHMYRQMLARKHLPEPGDVRRFRQMQPLLPSGHRMKLFVAIDTRGHPCAGAICSAMGRRGIFLFGATADEGMTNKASYLVHWRVIQWLKQIGCVEYDLHGSDVEANPGVYAFKMGLCGRNGAEVAGLPGFEAYDGPANRIILTVADRVRRLSRTVRRLSEHVAGFQG